MPRLALTATATPPVQADIAAQLALRDPLRLVGHIDRPNLVYRSLPRREALKQIEEVAGRHAGDGGIVYCLTRAETERVADLSLIHISPPARRAGGPRAGSPGARAGPRCPCARPASA